MWNGSIKLNIVKLEYISVQQVLIYIKQLSSAYQSVNKFEAFKKQLFNF